LHFVPAWGKLTVVHPFLPMKILSRFLPLLCSALLLLATGCGTATSSATPPPAGVTPVAVQFFLVVRGGDANTAVPLPVSGIRVPIDTTSPVLNRDMGDIAGVEVVRTEHEGLAMVFHLAGGRFGSISAFNQMTATHQGYRLVMTLNGRPFAAKRIDTPISNGLLAVFPELDEKAIMDAANGINYVSSEMQRQLAKR
jgi:hypothetical protein